MTPLGMPVVPEVYISRMTSDGSRPAAPRDSAQGSASTPSSAVSKALAPLPPTTNRCSSRGSLARIPSTMAS